MEEKQTKLPDYLKNDEHYDRKFGDKFTADINSDEIKSDKDRETAEKISKKER